MRLVIFIILFSVSGTVFAQINGDKILIYKHGCNGQCHPINYDSCGFIKDTIFDLIIISKIGWKYYNNGKLFSKQKADSLNDLIDLNFGSIEKLAEKVEFDKTLKFVPPFPSCCEFEDYTIFKNNKQVHFVVFHGESGSHGETWTELDEKTIEMFRIVSDIIK